MSANFNLCWTGLGVGKLRTQKIASKPVDAAQDAFSMSRSSKGDSLRCAAARGLAVSRQSSSSSTRLGQSSWLRLEYQMIPTTLHQGEKELTGGQRIDSIRV